MSPPSRPRLVAAFAAVYVFWGATFLAIRYAVADIPPLITIGLRCAGGAALLAAWLGYRGRLERPSRSQWLTAAGAGAFLFLGCHGILAWAEQRVTSGEAALFMTAIPLWIVLLDGIRARRSPEPRVLAGLGLGVAGVALLSWEGGGWSGGLLDRVALLASALFWAVGSLVARDRPVARSAAQSTAMQLAAGSVVVLAASGLTGELSGWSVAAVTPRAWLALGFLVTGGTVLGFAAYTWLLRVTTPAAASSYAFVNPVIALGLAWAVGDGTLTPGTIVAGALVIGAVALTRPTRTAPSGPPLEARGSVTPGRAAA